MLIYYDDPYLKDFHILEIIKILDQNLLNIKVIKIYNKETIASCLYKFPFVFNKNYNIIFNQINHKYNDFFLNFYNSTKDTSIYITSLNLVKYRTAPNLNIINLLIFLLNLKNFHNYNPLYVHIFFKKIKLLKSFINYSFVNNFLLKEDFDFFKSLYFLKLKSIVLKKSIKKKLKKRKIKAENLPKKLKNFYLKKLSRNKYKYILFKNKRNLINNVANTWWLRYFNYCKIFFKKKKILNLSNFFNSEAGVSNYSTYHINTLFYKNFFSNFFKKNLIVHIRYCSIFYKSSMWFSFFKIKIFYKRLSSDMFIGKNIVFGKNYTIVVKKQQTKFYTSNSVSFNCFFFKNHNLLADLIVNKKNNFFKKTDFLKNLCKSVFVGDKSVSLLNFFFLNFLSNTNINKYSLTDESYKIHNYSLVFNLDSQVKNIVLQKFKNTTTPNIYKYMYFYIVSFLEIFFKKKIFFKMKTKIQPHFSILEEFNNIFIKHRSMQSKIGRGFFFSEMLEILYVSFLYKDLAILIDWFIKTMERIQFRNHKKFLSVFKFIITMYSDFFMRKNHVKGFFFDIRGKVGVSGNAKKRHFSFNEGKFSKTTKKSKFEYQQQIVRTFTGALGVTMIMYY